MSFFGGLIGGYVGAGLAQSSDSSKQVQQKYYLIRCVSQEEFIQRAKKVLAEVGIAIQDEFKGELPNITYAITQYDEEFEHTLESDNCFCVMIELYTKNVPIISTTLFCQQYEKMYGGKQHE